ncbi:hypothetical protein ACVW0A_002919 [Pseudomonas sp. TE3610]
MKFLSVRLQNPLNFSIGQTLKGLALSAVSGSPLPTNPDPDIALRQCPGFVRLANPFAKPRSLNTGAVCRYYA